MHVRNKIGVSLLSRICCCIRSSVDKITDYNGLKLQCARLFTFSVETNVVTFKKKKFYLNAYGFRKTFFCVLYLTADLFVSRLVHCEQKFLQRVTFDAFLIKMSHQCPSI